MDKLRRNVFGTLYRRYFGNGQAYKSPIHYSIADGMKKLAGWPCKPKEKRNERLPR